MRKLMLAGAAMLGATSGIASAQAPVTVGAKVMTTPSQGTMALTVGARTNAEQHQQRLRFTEHLSGWRGLGRATRSQDE